MRFKGSGLISVALTGWPDEMKEICLNCCKRRFLHNDDTLQCKMMALPLYEYVRLDVEAIGNFEDFWFKYYRNARGYAL